MAAAYCRVHPNTLSRWLATGLPHVRLVGVIRMEAMEKALERYNEDAG